MSRMGRMKPVGTPFSSGLWDKDKCVLAMQMGRFPKPWGKTGTELGEVKGWQCNKEHLGTVLLQFTWNTLYVHIYVTALLQLSHYKLKKKKILVGQRSGALTTISHKRIFRFHLYNWLKWQSGADVKTRLKASSQCFSKTFHISSWLFHTHIPPLGR